MGLALVVGVATKISVEKKKGYDCILKKHYCSTKGEILEELKNEINLNFYNVEENEKYIFLEIKEEVILDNIYNLLISETKEYDWEGEDKINFEKLLESIKNADSLDKIRNIIKEKGYYYFHLMEGCPWESISYISKSRYVIYAELLVYNYAFKAYLEFHGRLMKYLRDKLRKGIDNPLKDDIFLMLTTG